VVFPNTTRPQLDRLISGWATEFPLASAAHEASAFSTDIGVERSLEAKLFGVRRNLENGNVAAARGGLNAFLAEVRAQRGLHIEAGTADFLIAAANSILSTL
jgi:hypothetical protein